MKFHDSNSISLAPSILSADFWQLGQEIQKVEKAGVPLLHLDVMDGHFVPNLTIGPAIVQAIRKQTSLFLDTHLMLEHPASYIEPFAKAGSDLISVHLECKDNLDSLLDKIHHLNIKAGIAISPDTEIEKVEPYLDKADMFLVMSVYPGFGGQKFRAESLAKISWLKTKTEKPIEVDGGINLETVHDVIEAGAQWIVAGSGVFRAENIEARVQAFHKIFTEFTQKTC